MSCPECGYPYYDVIAGTLCPNCDVPKDRQETKKVKKKTKIARALEKVKNKLKIQETNNDRA